MVLSEIADCDTYRFGSGLGVRSGTNMFGDFSTEYSKRSDDELLLLASERASLTTEAATALDAELRRRNLTDSEQIKRQQFAKRNEQREARRRRRKLFGSRSDRSEWVDVFW